MGWMTKNKDRKNPETKTIKLGQRISLLLTLTCLAGLLGGLNLGLESSRLEQQDFLNREMQAQETQLKVLVRNLQAQVEAVRMRAVHIRDVKLSAIDQLLAEDHQILHWSQFSLKEDEERLGLESILYSARNPSWLKGLSSNRVRLIENIYLRKVMKEMNLSSAGKEGFAITRIKHPDHPRREWLALGFLRKSSHLNQNQEAVVALVDPVSLFSSLTDFANLSGKEYSRAYLIAEDGKTLLHSQSPFIGADFSGTEVFRRVVSPLMKGMAFESNTQLQAIDERLVKATALRLPDSSLSLVLEKPISEDFSSSWEQITAQSLLTLAVLIALILLFSLLIRRHQAAKQESRTQSPQAPGPVPLSSFQAILEEEDHTQDIDRPEMVDLSLEDHARAKVAEKTAEIAARKSQEFLSQSQMSQKTAISASIRPRIFPTKKAIMTKLVEELKLPQLPAQDLDLDRSSQSEFLHLARQFELKALQLGQPAFAASMLTDAAVRLLDAPALFFAFDAATQTARLQTDSGFSESPDSALYFEIPEASEQRILDCATRGRMPALAQFQPIRDLVTRHLQGQSFESWAITTPEGHSPAQLFGVLIVLSDKRLLTQENPASPENRQLLLRLLRTTGIIYERAEPDLKQKKSKLSPADPSKLGPLVPQSGGTSS